MQAADSKFCIKDWAEEDRPREKMMKKGAAQLSDSELLAIVLGSGSQKESALDLAKRMLGHVGNNLTELGKMDVREMVAVFHGIGPAKAVGVMAALELGKRRRLSESPDKECLNSSKKVYELMYPRMADLQHEECWAVFLNPANKLIGMHCISHGGVSETTVDPRIVLKHAIRLLATSVILCHNHPSGSPNPSPADNHLTKQLESAAKLMHIHLLDHLIFCDRNYYSYADHGLLP